MKKNSETFRSFLDIIYSLHDTLHEQTSCVPSLFHQSSTNSRFRQHFDAGVKMRSPSCHFVFENRWTHFSTKFSKQFAPELRPILKYFYQKSKPEKKSQAVKKIYKNTYTCVWAATQAAFYSAKHGNHTNKWIKWFLFFFFFSPLHNSTGSSVSLGKKG